jgi:hypothetical protein
MGKVQAFLELFLVEGGAIGWAVWELWTLRRRKDAPKPDDASQNAPSPKDAGHPKG